MLWQRGLVMKDVETGTLWSHILGQAMDGKLKGTVLKIIPADMTTWKAWKEEYPETTLLNLPPTRFRVYNKDIYENERLKPRGFVYGAVVKGQAYHGEWSVLMKEPTQNLKAGGTPVLALTEQDTTSVRLYDRRVDGKTLVFKAKGDGIVDQQTGSGWNRRGEAISGELKGKTLEPVVGLVSFRTSWKVFQPKSKPFGVE